MEIISSDQAPQAVGPYSQAVKVNGMIFCSGQIALTTDGTLVEGDVSAHCEQVMKNLEAVLSAAGSGFDRVVRTTIFLTDINDFARVNEVYGRYFGDHKPARATFAVKDLPKGALIEIDCIAVE